MRTFNFRLPLSSKKPLDLTLLCNTASQCRTVKQKLQYIQLEIDGIEICFITHEQFSCIYSSHLFTSVTSKLHCNVTEMKSLFLVLRENKWLIFFPLVLSEINNSFVSLNTKGKFRSILELALIIVRVYTWRTDPWPQAYHPSVRSKRVEHLKQLRLITYH